MSHIQPVPFSKGYVSTGGVGRDAYDLDPGELTRMLGAYYRKNDPTGVWKIPGRSVFGSAGTSPIKGLAICQFDQGGTDRLLAFAGTSILTATPGPSGSFSSLVTGLNAAAKSFVACHQDDRWYLGNGYDANRVLIPDGTVRQMCMAKPVPAPTVTTSAIANTTSRPTSTAGTMTQAQNSYDADPTTFGNLSLHGSYGSAVYQTWTGWSADATSVKKISVTWGASVLSGSTVVLEWSVDGGVTWNDILRQHFSGAGDVISAVADTLISYNSSVVTVRLTVAKDYRNSNAGSIADARIYDVNIQYGSDANITTTDGIYYVTTEYYAPDDLEGPPSEPSAKVTLSSKSQAIIARPPQINPHATHWHVYRVGDGVTPTRENYGRVSSSPIPITDATWADNFVIPITEQALPIIALLAVGDTNYFRDDPAPAFVSMVSWKGSIFGISRDNRRRLYYSEGGRPESFPAVYVVASFPLEDHDGLVGHMPVGETLVLLCAGAVLAIDDVPRVTDGVYDNTGAARPLKGHPGCVGDYAYTTYSVSGEPRGAWVSPFGVYITNGTTCECISTDLAWDSEVNVPTLSSSVLKWDAKNLILWFNFDSNGNGINDREIPFHMAPMHSKGGNRPKLGQPTPKATSCMTSALISSTHYRFSGDPTNGNVYIEETNDSGVSMSVRSHKITNQKTDMAVLKATVLHADSGHGESGILTTTAYRDSANSSTTRTNEIDLSGARGTTVFIGRAAEGFAFQFDYDGDGPGGVLGLQLEIEGQGRSGSANRWVASSVTP